MIVVEATGMGESSRRLLSERASQYAFLGVSALLLATSAAGVPLDPTRTKAAAIAAAAAIEPAIARTPPDRARRRCGGRTAIPGKT